MSLDSSDTTWPAAAPDTMQIPEFALIVLLGLPAAGKSTFAQQHFLATEIVSLANCRAMIGDDPEDPAFTAAATDLMFTIADQRLNQGKLTVLDARFLSTSERVRVIHLAKAQHVRKIAIVINPPLSTCRQRLARHGPVDELALSQAANEMRQTLKRLPNEGFKYIHVLDDPGSVNTVLRTPLVSNKKDLKGPFDIIGDVHGCCDELEQLLTQLGYQLGADTWFHPDGRQAIFVGDLVDRGPRNLDSLFLARDMVASGQALCLEGNHENKFARYLNGKKVKQTHGFETTVAEIEALPVEQQSGIKTAARAFIESLTTHYVLDDGRLVVAHAGLKEAYHGRSSGRTHSFALYGDTTGESDSFGLPVRLNWALDYQGAALVVYGHVPVPEPEFINNTIDIDNGCVFGGKLTALRYPELEIVSVPAAQVYYAPVRPLGFDQKDTQA